MIDLAADLDLIRAAAVAAGDLALSERDKGIKIWSKSGGSPVTSADLAVDALLKDILLSARPDYGWLSEETADSPSVWAANASSSSTRSTAPGPS
jgi:myo-inositol-1(or 4)-monophosphatase